MYHVLAFLTVENLVTLITNVGLAGTIVILQLLQNHRREQKAAEATIELHKFHRETLINIVTKSTEALSNTAKVTERVLDILEDPNRWKSS